MESALLTGPRVAASAGLKAYLPLLFLALADRFSSVLPLFLMTFLLVLPSTGYPTRVVRQTTAGLNDPSTPTWRHWKDLAVDRGRQKVVVTAWATRHAYVQDYRHRGGATTLPQFQAGRLT